MPQQRWAICDAKGRVIRTLYTCGHHPGLERGEESANVMRTHPIHDDLWTQACRIVKGVPVLDEEAATEVAHRAILVRYSTSNDILRALAFGMPEEERQALAAAFAWLEAQPKGIQP